MVLSPWTCVCGQANAGPSPCSRCLTPAPPSARVEPSRADVARPRLLAPLALLVAVLLIAGASAAGVVASRGDEPVGTVDGSAGGRTIEVSPQGPSAALPGADGAIASALPGLMRFVEEARGLPFTQPVKVSLLPDEAFRTRLAALEEAGEEAEARRERTRTSERVLRALGLLEAGVDLEEASRQLLGDAVAGFYDAVKDDLVVRGDELTPAVAVTFVHELTHALQDQHFDLDREDLDERDDESAQAFASLVEGDAVRIGDRYLESLPESEQKAAQREEMEAAAGIGRDLPRILLELVAFPYLAGPGFVTALADGGGQARVDEAFRNPPTTTEQILHPDAYLADGEPPRLLENPRADGDVIDQGVVGELGLLLVLRRLVDADDAAAAARGWGGDRYVAWRDGEDTCVRTDVVMDTARDARELRAALREAASARPSLDVAASPETITFTSCG